jgi:hypothetical protein
MSEHLALRSWSCIFSYSISQIFLKTPHNCLSVDEVKRKIFNNKFGKYVNRSAKSVKIDNSIAPISIVVISFLTSIVTVKLIFATIPHLDVKKASIRPTVRSAFEQTFTRGAFDRLLQLVDLALAIHLRCTCPHQNENWLLYTDILVCHFPPLDRTELYRVRTT